MSPITLRIGPIDLAGHKVVRSAIRWLRADGQIVRAGEPIAYCNIGIVADTGAAPFADEARDLQVAFAPRIGGRLHHAAPAQGGFLDRLHAFRWSEDTVLARIVPDGACGRPLPGDPAIPRLLMLAGRRMSEIAEDRSGLMTGWHDRARGWWDGLDEGGAAATLLALGTCELGGALRGERSAFAEMFAASPGGGQVVVVQDEPLVPSARVLAEQIARTPEDMRAIAADAAAGLSACGAVPLAGDWLFMGALLAGLARAPVTEGYTMFGRAGLRRGAPAEAIALSLTAELPPTLRHRRLGYAIACHPFRLAQIGAATRAWLEANFVEVRRDLAAVAEDICALAAAARRATGAQLLMLNAISTQAYEDVAHYAAFDRPLGDTLSSVRAKERNVMLDELARSEGLALVDVDTIVAGQGMSRHLPDGTHPSGAVQAAVRAEILALLRERGVAGFAGESVGYAPRSRG